MGRVGALEIFLVNQKIRNAMSNQESPERILACSDKNSFLSLSVYLNYLLQRGITAPGEVLGAIPRKGEEQTEQ